MSPTCLLQSRCLLGESPLWDEATERLYFVDIKTHALHWRNADASCGVLHLDCPVTALATIVESTELLAATSRGLERIDPASGRRRLVAPIESDRPGNRPNDGKCDPQGRFWIGTMDDAEKSASGALYRIEASGAAVRAVDGVGISNGLDWSPDGKTMYFTDSMRSTIWRYAFDADTGAIGAPSAFAVVPESEGWPDGLTVDAEGYVWSAHWDGGRVTRYDPDGRIVDVIVLPVPRVTSCCFGGPALSTLFITSARVGLSEDALAAAPLSGGLFACEPGAKGKRGGRVRLAG